METDLKKSEFLNHRTTPFLKRYSKKNFKGGGWRNSRWIHKRQTWTTREKNQLRTEPRKKIFESQPIWVLEKNWLRISVGTQRIRKLKQKPWLYIQILTSGGLQGCRGGSRNSRWEGITLDFRRYMWAFPFVILGLVGIHPCRGEGTRAQWGGGNWRMIRDKFYRQ